MSKIKKVAISILSGIMIIFGIQSMSNAYFVGQNLTITYNQYVNSSNIFCAEHGQALTSDNNYKVISNVKIEGTKSTDHEDKTIDSWHNAKFAYILSADNGTSHDAGPVQNEIWNYGYTWMNNVGKNHNGLSLGFMSSVTGNKNTETTNLDKEATNYANNIKNGSSVTDNTNKDNIKVEAYNKDGKQYMRIGPFNWSFAGKLTEVSIYDQNSKDISEKLYSTFNGKEENWINVESIKSNKDFYISIPADRGVSKITKVTGKMSIDVKAVNIWFLESTTGYKQNLIIREPYGATETINLSFDYNISILGNLKVIKVNQANEQVRLANVGFYIQNKNTGKYVKEAADKTISYVDNKEDATEFITDIKGEIIINNLIVGTYAAYEKNNNPNYGYVIVEDGMQKEVVVDKTAELKIPNKQKYIKLSGYVWVDNISGKQSTIDNLYNDKDSDDMLLDGITVRLKDRTTGQTVKEAITANGGKYLFIDVLVDDLDKYYIEFEYDGLTYTNVVPHIDKDNGSKSAENATVRDNFNKGFSVVEGKSESQSITRDSNNNETHTLTYNSDKTAHTATLINVEPEPMILANTDEAKYSIKAHFVPGEEEIKYINLGLYKRVQPDISLVKDLHSVKLSINGKDNIYNYSQRFKEYFEPKEDDLNVGVKYKNEYTGSYNRAIYKADYIYNNPTNKSKNLKVYLTYKIRLINETTGLAVKVNSIVDYYDERYILNDMGAVGRNVNKNGEIKETEGITYDKQAYGEGYSKVILYTDTQIGSQEMSDIYVQFELNREAVVSILSGRETLENVAEINSYSVFDTNGNAYAGIDKDSNPGNAIPGEIPTYQDDTDSAPSLLLEATESRKMTGTVFLDESTGGVGLVRQGDGIYDEAKEKGIAGVEVILTETTGTGLVYKEKTDENGHFEFTDYIPGDYTLTYTWGDETYTVQNYKGTIYNDKDRANNKEWYKTTNPRYSDATDDYALRQAIDEEMKDITNKTETTINKMNSTTPIMGIGVENVDTSTASTGNKYEFIISNIDFGIVERAKQDVALDKRVATFKVTLANGQVIADVKIDENGKMTGETNHVTYMGPSAATMPNNGFVKLELDSELIQGAKVEVGYEIKVTNNSELDYLSENFYKYGIIEGKAVTITPSAIIDYLDKDWAFDATKNEKWEVKTLDDIKDIVAETVYNNEDSDISEKTILYTESLKTEKLEPTKSATVMINVSKLLSNSDEIALDNETEVVRLEKSGGSKPIPEPGNYIPGTGEPESDSDMSETVIVTPSTGDNQNFIIPVIVGVIALVILGAGVVIIKKKTL